MNLKPYTHKQHYELLTNWLVDGYKWDAGIPKDHLGTTGLVAEVQGEVIGMGFMGWMEGTKLAMFTHMVGAPSATGPMRARAILMIMKRFKQDVFDRHGPDAGAFAVYSNPFILKCAEKVGFTTAIGDKTKPDYFLYMVYKTLDGVDYVND